MKWNGRIAWIDLETTGLDPKRDHVLEVGVVVTEGLHTEIAGGQWIVTHGEHVLGSMASDVYRMHWHSGLVGDIRSRHYSVTSDPWVVPPVEAFDPLIDVLLTFAAPPGEMTGLPILGGSNVKFDRGFLPDSVTDLLHYRDIDASIASRLWELAGGDVGDLPGGRTHRVMDDLTEAIERVRFITERIKV